MLKFSWRKRERERERAEPKKNDGALPRSEFFYIRSYEKTGVTRCKVEERPVIHGFYSLCAEIVPTQVKSVAEPVHPSLSSVP